jgi:hypothetical protein
VNLLFEEILRRHEDLTAPSSRQLSMARVVFASMQAILHGEYSLAEQKAERRVLKPGDWHGVHFGIYGMQMFTIRREQGRLAGSLRLLSGSSGKRRRKRSGSRGSC